MMNKPIDIAVLGVGRWGTHLLRNVLEHPQARVRAIADPSSDCLEKARYQFSLGTDIIITPHWDVAIATPGIEAVIIATPAATHTQLIRTALESGLHVLVEKPMTLDVAEAEALCTLAQTQQRCLMVDHTYLFHPAIATGQTIMHQGTLGTLRYGYATRTHLGPIRSDVDVLWDLAIHDITIFNAWLGDRPSHVHASGSRWLQSHAPHSQHFPAGLADVVWATLLYPTGFQATLHLCWLNPDKQRRLAIVGSNGTLVFDEMQPDRPLTLLHGQLHQNRTHVFPDRQCQEAIAIPQSEPLKYVCSHFLSQIHDDVQSPFPPNHSDGQVGTDLIRILTALSRSLNEGGRAIAIEYRH